MNFGDSVDIPSGSRKGDSLKSKRKRKNDGFVMDLKQVHEAMKKDIKPSKGTRQKPFNLAMDIFRK